MRITIYIAFAAALSLMTACIDDDDENCVKDFVVDIGVADKNYTNTAQFPQWPAEDENQPFGHFENTLYYKVTDTKSGITIQQSDVMNINTMEATYKLTLKDLPIGEYTLTVWGNLTSDVSAGILHPNNKEHTDIYVGTIDFCNKCNSASTMQLQRTKGKLLIFCTNFPDSITRMHQSLTGIFGQVDGTLNYSETASVEKESQPLAVNTLAVAPALAEKSAKLKLSFYDADGTSPLLSVPPMELNIHRNELTAVNVDYNQASSAWDIWIYLDGEWTLIHHLYIK